MCFFFNDTATTEIYTLSLHDALPIFYSGPDRGHRPRSRPARRGDLRTLYALHGQVPHRRYKGPRRRGRQALYLVPEDRKSTRLNSSHANISYAVFCLKKKKQNTLTSP